MRVVVGEDSLLFREGLVRLLEDEGHVVVASVGDADLLVNQVDFHVPDLAVVDIRMPPNLESDGALAARLIREHHAGMGILLLSQHVELRHCAELIGTPGFGYLLKDRVLDLKEFGETLRRVGSGGTALDPEIVRALVQSRASASPLGALTPRELEVLGLVAQGHSNTTVATRLLVSERTVETHMRAVFAKLGLDDDGSMHRRVRAVVTFLESHQ